MKAALIVLVLLHYGVTVANGFVVELSKKTSYRNTQTSIEVHAEETSSSVTETQMVKVQIPKPLGIVLEESEDDVGGVKIIEVNPKGNAAQTLSIGSLCVRDKVLAINGEDVSVANFDDVMEKIIASNSPVELTLERSQGSIVISWGNRVSVAAQPGEYLGNVAFEAGMKIPYSCRSGSCGTCEQAVSVDSGKEHRYYRPCSFRLPIGVHSMALKPSDRIWA